MERVTEQKPELGDAEDASASPKELALFALRAVRENISFSLLAAGLTAALGATIVTALPDTYDATCKIFVQDSGSVTSSLASGHERFRRPLEGARGLEEFILAHDNLLSIVREAKLVERWPATRRGAMRLKDQVRDYLLGPVDPAIMERGLLEMLALSITAAKESESVRIHAQWRDAQSSYDIARLVERNFLAARAAHDLGPIQRAIPFLEQQLQEADEEIESAVTRLQKAKSDTVNGVVAEEASATAPTNAPAGSDRGAIEFATLADRLSQVRQKQRALTEPRRRKVAELKLELIEMSAQYSADHPLIRQQEARIAILNESPAELTDLREEELGILSALSSRGVTVKVPQAGKPREVVVADDPEVAAAQARLQSALRKSDDTTAKLESARIELATAEADFQHRYTVVEEPDVPGTPLKPKKKLMMFGLVALVTLLAGILTGVLRELRKGRLVETWQVRQLGLELLGEIELK